MTTIKRFTFLLPVAVLLAAGAAPAENRPMNILVLLAADWRYDTLYCAGDPEQKQRLAEMRSRFAELKQAAR